jgi:hypothetical protein
VAASAKSADQNIELEEWLFRLRSRKNYSFLAL